MSLLVNSKIVFAIMTLLGVVTTYYVFETVLVYQQLFPYIYTYDNIFIGILKFVCNVLVDLPQMFQLDELDFYLYVGHGGHLRNSIHLNILNRLIFFSFLVEGREISALICCK